MRLELKQCRNCGIFNPDEQESCCGCDEETGFKKNKLSIGIEGVSDPFLFEKLLEDFWLDAAHQKLLEDLSVQNPHCLFSYWLFCMNALEHNSKALKLLSEVASENGSEGKLLLASALDYLLYEVKTVHESAADDEISIADLQASELRVKAMVREIEAKKEFMDSLLKDEREYKPNWSQETVRAKEWLDQNKQWVDRDRLHQMSTDSFNARNRMLWVKSRKKMVKQIPILIDSFLKTHPQCASFEQLRDIRVVIADAKKQMVLEQNETDEDRARKITKAVSDYRNSQTGAQKDTANSHWMTVLIIAGGILLFILILLL